MLQPARVLPFTVWVLVGIETLVALLVVAQLFVPALAPIGSIAAVALTLGFVIVLLRIRTLGDAPDCGCFGSEENWSMSFARATALLALSIWSTGSTPSLDPVRQVIMGTVVISLAFVVSSVRLAMAMRAVADLDVVKDSMVTRST